MWTYTHCYVPPRADDDDDDSGGFMRCISVPSGHMLTSLTGQFIFTTFYFLVLTWSLLNTFAWALDTKFEGMYPKPNGTESGGDNRTFTPPTILMPLGLFSANDTANQTVSTPYPPLEIVFGGDWFTTFTYVNLLILGSVICFVEAVLLNQVKAPVVSLLPDDALGVSLTEVRCLGGPWS
jgi:hypothetical protein